MDGVDRRARLGSLVQRGRRDRRGRHQRDRPTGPVADVDGDGQLDLAVLMVDAPAGRNQGYYRSGSLHADGTVSAWRPWAAVADWDFWENQGAGIAIADLDGDGTPELVVMAVDNPPEQNGGYYSVGWRLEAGRPAGRLGPMAADPGLALLGEPGRRHHRRGPWPAWDAASGPHRRRQSARAERRLVPGAGCDDRPGHGRADGGLAPVGERLAGQPSPRGPAAHRQRVVFRGLGQRPGSAQRPAVRDGGLALSAAGIQPPRHPGRPVLLWARVPARRAAAGQRWHRALRPVLRPAAGGHLRSAGRPGRPGKPNRDSRIVDGGTGYGQW